MRIVDLSRRRMLGRNRVIVAPDGLVANYKLNETSGLTVLDSAGVNNGTSADCAVNQTGKLDKAYLFNGTTSNIQIPHSTDFDFSNGTNDIPFSASMWVKITSGTTFLLMGKTNGTSRTWELIYESSNLYFRLCNNGSVSTRIEKISSFPFGVWQNVIITYDGSATISGMKLYTNNIAATSQLSNVNYVKMAQNTNPVWIGKFPALTSYTVNGLIDEVEIYRNHLLTTDERNAIWNNGNGRSLNL